MTAALAIEGLGHSFAGRRALAEVSFTIAEGVFAVLLGRNGAGKTTLFSLATGLYHAREGAIRVFGEALRSDPAAALATMGVVFQQPTLDLDLTAGENLQYHAALHGLPPGLARRRADEELDRLGVLDRKGDRVRALSGGQRRRVEIARALMHRPRLLLLDEPTAGLDVPGRQSLATHVRSLCAERGIAVLWATHLLEEVRERDHLIVLDGGRVKWTGALERIAADLGVANLPEAFDALTGLA